MGAEGEKEEMKPGGGMCLCLVVIFRLSRPGCLVYVGAVRVLVSSSDLIDPAPQLAPTPLPLSLLLSCCHVHTSTFVFHPLRSLLHTRSRTSIAGDRLLDRPSDKEKAPPFSPLPSLCITRASLYCPCPFAIVDNALLSLPPPPVSLGCCILYRHL
jgi:hypothetical protein